MYRLLYCASKDEKSLVEKKLAEIYGLQKAAQKAIEKLVSLTNDKNQIINKTNYDLKNITEILEKTFDYKYSDIEIDEKKIEQLSSKTEMNAYDLIMKYFNMGLGCCKSLELLCLKEKGSFVNYEGVQHY